MIIDELMNRLADAYDKSPDSNIRKLLTLAANRFEEQNTTLDLIQAWRDIDQAQGATLDLMGKDFGEYRHGKNDADYRQAIKTRIRSNLSIGDIETINEVSNVLLGEAFKHVVEGYEIPDEYGIDYINALIMVVVNLDKLNSSVPFAELDRITAGGIGATWDFTSTKNLKFTIECTMNERPQQQYIYAGQMPASLTTYTTGGLL